MTEDSQMSTREMRCAQLAAKLFDHRLKCQEHPRVQRWETEGMESIRSFIDKANLVFHKYFEDINFTRSSRNFFIDVEEVEEEEKSGSEEWISPSQFNVTLTEEGVLQFTFSKNHHLAIFPLRKDLFENKLAQT